MLSTTRIVTHIAAAVFRDLGNDRVEPPDVMDGLQQLEEIG